MPRAAIINGGGRVVNVIEADWRTAVAPAGNTVVDASDPKAAVGGKYTAQGRNRFALPLIAAVVDPVSGVVKDVIFANAATATPPLGMVLVDASLLRSVSEWWRLDAGTNELRPPTASEDATDEIIRNSTPIVIAG